LKKAQWLAGVLTLALGTLFFANLNAAETKCPSNERSCGSECYNPIRSKCVNGIVCGTSEQACGKQCYDPIRSQCLSGVICAKGESLCKGQCYDPVRSSCK
jgi:hypothetical protein